MVNTVNWHPLGSDSLLGSRFDRLVLRLILAAGGTTQPEADLSHLPAQDSEAEWIHAWGLTGTACSVVGFGHSGLEKSKDERHTSRTLAQLVN